MFSLFRSSSMHSQSFFVFSTRLLAPATIILVYRGEPQTDWLSHRKNSTASTSIGFNVKGQCSFPSIHKPDYHDPQKVARSDWQWQYSLVFFPFPETRKVAPMDLAHRRRGLVATGTREHGVVLLTYDDSAFAWSSLFLLLAGETDRLKLRCIAKALRLVSWSFEVITSIPFSSG